MAVTLANAWSLQHEVTLFTLLARGPLFSLLNEKVRVVHGLTRGNTLWRKLTILAKLTNEARKHDVVIAGLEITATYFAYVAAKLARKPIIAWVHTLLSEYLTLHYFSSRHILLCRFLYQRITHQVFVSEGAKASMLRLLNNTKSQIKQDKAQGAKCINNTRETVNEVMFKNENWYKPTSKINMSVIYNPIEFSPVSSNIVLPYLPSKPFILGVGRLAIEKGFDLLINAFAKLRQTGEDVVLLILGEGELRAELRAQIARLGLAQHVYLPGYVDNAVAYYQYAAVFALSSTVEGLSMALVEAMHSGVPIVATHLPSVYELLGEEVRTVPQGDVTGFAQQLSNALHHRESVVLKQKRQRTAANFSPAYALNRWESVLTLAVKKSDR